LIGWHNSSIQPPQRLEDYTGFVKRVKSAFFLSTDHIAAQGQTEPGALKQSGDLLESLQRFDLLCDRAGCRPDVSEITMLFPKLDRYYRESR